MTALPPIHLTFDDGPDGTYTPRILDMLEAAGVKATFFMIGALAVKSPTLVHLIRARGHEVGNHTFSHRHPKLLTTRQARMEVADGAAAIADILGEQPRLFRPPHGARNPAMLEEAASLDETIVQWDLSAIDWGPMGFARAIARRLGRAGPGDVILMHDGGRGINRPGQLIKVLPDFLQRITESAMTMTLLPPSALAGGSEP